MTRANTVDSLKHLRDDPSRVVVLGAGRDGAAMVRTFQDEGLMRIIAVVDVDEHAPGMILAKEFGIKTYADVEEALLASAPCLVFNLTGNEMVEEVAASILGVGGVIGGAASRFMWRMVTDLKEAKNDLEFQATHDVLTNLVNRRYMLDQLQLEIGRCKRYGIECSVMMVDLDNFKQVNDAFGHAAGDEVLRVVSARIKANLRATDTLARWGGEEFLVLLPHTDKTTAMNVAEKSLGVVTKSAINCGGAEVAISFSAGVASFEELDASLSVKAMLDVLLGHADKRLYQAKEAGRAQVVSG
ncbi:MAG: diguanylate cyclase [Ghiorsea sp.]|nr:diguanylate cyclase [Ghiorsea sp.]